MPPWTTFASVLATVMLSGCANAQPSAESSPLTLEREIALSGVKGRIDHLALDVAHRRLFVAEVANGTVDMVDLVSGQRLRIDGLKEPQGIGYLPLLDQVVVACGGDGTVRFYNAGTLAPVGRIELGEDADNVRHAPNGRIAVGYGSGGIALIDPASRTIVRRIALPVHPEGFQIDQATNRLYVNLPNARAIAAVDLETGKVVAQWSVPHRLNFPMALAPDEGVVAIASRLPAHVTWMEIATGAVRLDLPACGDADDLFHDQKRHQWYVSCGSGKVSVFRETGAKIEPSGIVASASGARTSLFSPELDRLFVAAPAGYVGTGARILVFKPNS